jgi:predicted DNA-binding transcriptional regulator AlpA
VPIVGRIRVVARSLGTSTSTIRRRLKDDADFPKPFRLADRGPLLWLMSDVRAYLARKAGRPVRPVEHLAA